MSATETATEQAAIDLKVLRDHFVMWHWMGGEGEPPGEWRCACGLKFGFSDSATKHQADMLAQQRAADICLTCSGGGRVLWVNAHGQPTDAATACPTCGGTGRAADTGDRETLAAVWDEGHRQGCRDATSVPRTGMTYRLTENPYRAALDGEPRRSDGQKAADGGRR